jgi:hypothetical protein
MSSFLSMVAKAKSSSNNDGDYFNENLKGVIEIERLFQHNGEKGTSVILTATIVSCEPKVEGAKVHLPGAKVKKVYSISKFPTVAPGQLKGDILSVMGLKEDDLSSKDIEGLLGEIFEESGSPGFELRGYRCAFNTKVVDRSAKGKENITAVYFNHMPNDEKELAARKAAVDARLSGAKA